jgi:hypothetical protein
MDAMNEKDVDDLTEPVIKKIQAEERYNVIIPASPGVIGADKTKWPAVFMDPTNSTRHFTATYRGMDRETGLTKVEMGPPSASPRPAILADIGAGKLSPADRDKLDTQLTTDAKRCPLLLREEKTVDGQMKFAPVTAFGGNENGLKVRDTVPAWKDPAMETGAAKQAEMAYFAREVRIMPLPPAAAPSPDQTWGAWSSDALNKSLTQSIAQIKQGMPYVSGAQAASGEAGPGIIPSLARRAIANIDAAAISVAGTSVMQQPRGDDPAHIYNDARQEGRLVSVHDLLQRPEPGTLVSHGPDSLGVVYHDATGEAQVVESATIHNEPGLRITPLDAWAAKHLSEGSDITAMAPALTQNPATLVSETQVQAAPAPAPIQPAAVDQAAWDQMSAARM